MSSFYNGTIKAWHELAKTVTDTKKINIFKTKLGEVWKDLPLKFYE